MSTNLFDSKVFGLNGDEIMQHQSFNFALELAHFVRLMLFCLWLKLQPAMHIYWTLRYRPTVGLCAHAV